jgi:hypothetical protein
MSKRCRHNQNGPIWHGCVSQFSALHARDFFSGIRLRYFCVANDLSLLKTVSKMAVFFVKDYKMLMASTTHVAALGASHILHNDGWRRVITDKKIALSNVCPNWKYRRASQQDSPPPMLATVRGKTKSCKTKFGKAKICKIPGPKKQARYRRQIAGANVLRLQIAGAQRGGKVPAKAQQKLLDRVQDIRWSEPATSRPVSGHARDESPGENQGRDILGKIYRGEVTDADVERAQKEYENPGQAGENSGRFGNVRRLLLSPQNNGSNNASLPFKRF